MEYLIITVIMACAIVACIGFLFISGYAVGRNSKRESASLWKDAATSDPGDYGRVIQTYPVALYAPDFGVIVDQAEFHPNKSDKWLSVPYGDPVRPFAWYDLPAPPWPALQDMG